MNYKIFAFKHNNATITTIHRFMGVLCFGKHFASRIPGVALQGPLINACLVTSLVALGKLFYKRKPC